MDEAKNIEAENTYLARVYQKFPVTLDRGKGATLYDLSGKEYIDCMSGYGVSIVGHSHPKIISALRKQSKKLISCHGSFYNKKRGELLERLINVSPQGLDKVFLCNSGAESVECAIKTAVRYTGKSEIIGMIGGYHGKTLGALSATWNPKYKSPFKSLVNQNFKFVKFGDSQKIEDAITKNTAAIIVEPIQGEGGVHVPPQGYLENLRNLCNKNDVVLIFDEVQTGFGRTGRMWASQHWNVTPDIMCISKGMGGGFPVGATIAKHNIMDSLRTGEHSSTFGGNPLACAAACATLDIIVHEKLVERASTVGEKLRDMLSQMMQKFRIVREVRGIGLMLGLETRTFVGSILTKCLEKGLILLYSGRNVIRFLPPLVIKLNQIEEAVSLLEETLEEEEIRLIPNKI